MPNCVNCGGETSGKALALSRFSGGNIPFTPLAVVTTKKGAVPLCDECLRFYSRGHLYRRLGFVVIIGGVLAGSALANIIGLSALWLLPISIAIGLFMVVKGRRRIAALEKRVGF